MEKEDKAKSLLKGKLIFLSLNSYPFPEVCPTFARKLQSQQLLSLGKSILKFRCSSNKISCHHNAYCAAELYSLRKLNFQLVPEV